MDVRRGQRRVEVSQHDPDGVLTRAFLLNRLGGTVGKVRFRGGGRSRGRT